MPLALDTCQSTHLSSPLINENLVFLLCHLQNQPLPPLANLTKNILAHSDNLRLIKNHWGFAWENVLLNPQCLLKKLFQSRSEMSIPSRSSRTAFTRYLNLAIQNLILQLTDTEDKCLTGILMPRDLLQRVTNHSGFSQLVHLDNLRAILEQGVCLTAKAARQSRSHDLNFWKHWKEGPLIDEGLNNFVCDLSSSLGFWVDSEFMALRIPSEQVWMGSRKHFLMISDVISQRFLVLLSSMLAEILEKSNYPKIEAVNAMFDWGDNILETQGNEGYKLLKMWESLCTGVILASQVDPAVDHLQFLKNMKDEFLSIDVGTVQFRKEALTKAMNILLPLRKNKDVMSQMYGLFRIWGHPTVALKDGLKRLRSVATVHREANPAMVRLVKLKWREMFFMSYQRKHSMWPKFEFLPNRKNPSSYLHQCLEGNLPLNLMVKQYDLGDWDDIKLSKNFMVADKFALSEMIADKATSLGYEELIKAIKTTQSIGSSSDRSVIIRWLRENINDPLEFLTKIDREGFNPDSGPVGVCAKEQEMPVYPRYFGLLPLDKRLYVVLTEAMLADSILPYFPEITMTYDSTTLLTNIYHQTKDLKANETSKAAMHTVVVNIDFMKWNSYMRASETNDLFQDFDHLFGFTNLYRRTHELFSGQLYLAMGVYLPEVNATGDRLVDSEIVWSDHVGGIEGLRQKGWTIFTVVILKMVSELTGVECSMMGQGDNQVLLCKYPLIENETVFSQHKKFLETLDMILEQIGPPLKPLETWSSSYFFSYGKYPLWKGVPLSMSQKKSCKCTRLTNDGLQNLNSTLSSIAANAAAATYSDKDPIIPYLIGTMESAAAIHLGLANPFYLDEPLIGDLTRDKAFLSIPREGLSKRLLIQLSAKLKNMTSKLDDDFFLVILNYPSILGGYPILMWNELIVHGFPDPLTLALNSVLKCYKNTKKEHLKEFYLKIANPELSGEVNPEMICTDPFSINVLQGSTASDKVKRMVFDFLSSQVSKNKYQNQVFMEFLQLAKTEQKDLCQVLYSSSPFNPILASSMIEATPVGSANKMMARVNKTNVLIKMMLSDRNKTELKMALEDEGVEIPEEFGSMRRITTFFTLFGRFEKNYFHGMIYNLSYSHVAKRESEVLSSCSFKRAEYLRERGWKKRIEGVTTAFPLEMFKPVYETQQLPENVNNSIGFFQTQVIGKRSFPVSEERGLGPFRPYFGSATKNKVTYEAKKLVPVAPPILKNLLELLCVPGWMTPVGSKLDELIRKIFSSVTDLDVDNLVPSEDEIAGSFNHRKGAEKAKMKATLSILWGWASYIISTSDHYSPELKDSTWTTDNLAINYQAIYLTLIFLLSLRLSQTGLPEETLTIRWYPDCMDCINPVNENQIDLPVDVDLESISSLNQHKNNPYCWVAGEGLLRSTCEQFSMGRRISLAGIESSLLLSLLDASVSHFLLSSNYIVSSINLHLQPVDYVLKTVPLIVCLKSSVIGVLEQLADDLFLKYLFYSTRNQWFKGKNFHRWVLAALESVSSIPFSWFYSLKNYYASQIAVKEFQIKFPNIRLPEGSPPSKEQIGLSFHKAIMATIQEKDYLEGLRARLTIRITRPYCISPHGFFHPIFIITLIDILEKKTIDQSVLFLGPFFDFFRTHVAVTPSSLKSPSWKELLFESKIDGSSYFSAVLRVQARNLSFVHFNLNALSEKAPRRCSSRVGDGAPLVSASLITPVTHLGFLSEGGVGLLDLYALEETPSVGRRKMTTLREEYSPASATGPEVHYFKISPTSTSALYKLVTILRENREQVAALSKKPRIICCTADGSGGFSATLFKLFPGSKLIYNTLRKFSDQNPDGTGFIYPPSLSQFHVAPESVLGLRLLECDISDLTSSETWNKMAELSETIDIMTCDAEGSGWEDPSKAAKIARGFSLMCHYKQVKLAILKGYASDVLTAYYVCNVLLCSFGKVTVFRSYFSTKGNTEVFFVASGLREFRLKMPTYTWSTNSGEIQGLTSNMTFDQFNNILKTSKECFLRGPEDFSFSYTRFILRLNPAMTIRPELSPLIRKMSLASLPGKVQFPGAWIKVSREKHPLIRFTGFNPKNNRRSTLTRKVQIELLFELLVLSSLCYPAEERLERMKRFFIEKDDWWFFCAGSFDGHYTMGLKKEKNVPKFSLEVSSIVSSLLSQKHFQKIFSEIGKFNYTSEMVQFPCRFSPLSESWATQDVLRIMYEERSQHHPINYPLWAAPIRSFWELPKEILDSLQLFNENMVWNEYSILPLSTIVTRAYKMRGATVENTQKWKGYYKQILSNYLSKEPVV